MRLDSLHSRSVDSLCKLYPLPEARAIAGVLCEERLSLKPYTYLVEPSTVISDEVAASFLADVERLSSGEPLQYVLGYALFCSRRFRVCPSVLIPRPETEEMTLGIMNEMSGRPGLRVLDLCTGSGCIAWTLSLELKDSHVTAVDISPEALDVARSQFPEAGPDFIRADVLALTSSDGVPSLQDAVRGEFDLIVSNPPYVLKSQKSSMRTNVLDHEPHLALFVPDDEALIFYTRIASFSIKRLAPDGVGFVEINDALGERTAQVFRDAGFPQVDLLKDVSGRDRVVRFAH